MRRSAFPIVAIVAIVIVVLTAPSFGEPGADEIIVNNADEVRTESVIRSESLEDTTTSIGPRTIVQYANEIRHIGLANVPGALQALLEQVAKRIVVQYANEIRQLELIHIPAQLQYVLGQAVDRVIIQYANENRTIGLAYPQGLVNDVTAPIISDIRTTEIGTTTATILWLTDEFAASRIEYGVNPGSYPFSVDDPLYLKGHGLTIIGLQPGTTHYFIIHCSDRNGNSVQSAQHNFTTLGENRPQYLPLIIH